MNADAAALHSLVRITSIFTNQVITSAPHLRSSAVPNFFFFAPALS
jgi:hypothetical protein